jgi:hypothetical protein
MAEHAYEIDAASREEVGLFYSTLNESEHFVLRADGTAMAMVSIIKVADRKWASLTVVDGVKRHGLRVITSIRRALRDRNETTYVVCGFPEAGRMLSILGFAPTEETVADNKRVWRWGRSE